MTSTARGGPLQVLRFTLAEQAFALPLGSVEEVARAVYVSPLPQAPDVVEGVVDFRGAVVPVLDVRRRFRLPEKALSPADRFVLARAGERRVVLRVDEVTGLLDLDPRQVDEPAALGPGVDYVAGVARLEDGLLFIHDLRTFLSDAEGAALDRALAAPPNA